MNTEAVEQVWSKVQSALDIGDEKQIISYAEKLSQLGDWRGSNTLGYMYEKIAKDASLSSGRIDRVGYSRAAKWYKIHRSRGRVFTS